MIFDDLVTNDAVLAELGRRLERLRLDRNRTQAQLATEAGIGRATLQRIERGDSAQVSSLVSVLRVFGLLGGLERLLPEPVPGPIEQLAFAGRQRRRASSRRRAEPGPPRPWSWGDGDPGAAR